MALRTLLNTWKTSSACSISSSITAESMGSVRSFATKLKTKSAVKKRVSVNANGVIKRGQANKSHLLTKKSTKRKRKLGQHATFTGQLRKNILAMLH